MELFSLFFSDPCSGTVYSFVIGLGLFVIFVFHFQSFPYIQFEFNYLLLLFIKYCYDSKMQNYTYRYTQRSFSSSPSFLIHSHSHSPILSTLFPPPQRVTHLICFWVFFTWITFCTNEQIYWYFLTCLSLWKAVCYILLYLPFALKNPTWKLLHVSNRDLPHSFLQLYMEHLTFLRVCTYKLMRMTNCIHWLWWLLIFKSK